MKPIFKLIIIFFIIVIYIFSINLFASLINFSSQTQSVSSILSGGFGVRIGMSDSVSISVIRAPHWYGRFYVNNGKEVLNLFYICNLPWKIQSYNFVIFHLIFLVTLILFTILIFIKKKVYKEENPLLEHENLAENYPFID